MFSVKHFAELRTEGDLNNLKEARKEYEYINELVMNSMNMKGLKDAIEKNIDLKEKDYIVNSSKVVCKINRDICGNPRLDTKLDIKDKKGKIIFKDIEIQDVLDKIACLRKDLRDKHEITKILK